MAFFASHDPIVIGFVFRVSPGGGQIAIGMIYRQDLKSCGQFKSMASLYILQSVDKKTFYIGSCVDLTLRLEQHRDKAYRNSFTSKGNWEVFLSINDLSYDQSRKLCVMPRLIAKKDQNNFNG